MEGKVAGDRRAMAAGKAGLGSTARNEKRPGPRRREKRRRTAKAEEGVRRKKALPGGSRGSEKERAWGGVGSAAPGPGRTGPKGNRGGWAGCWAVGPVAGLLLFFFLFIF